jgi:hypothetical protein
VRAVSKLAAEAVPAHAIGPPRAQLSLRRCRVVSQPSHRQLTVLRVAACLQVSPAAKTRAVDLGHATRGRWTHWLADLDAVPFRWLSS